MSKTEEALSLIKRYRAERYADHKSMIGVTLTEDYVLSVAEDALQEQQANSTQEIAG